MDSFWEKSINIEKQSTRPLLPFNMGQIGLVLTSGCLDGVVEEYEGQKIDDIKNYNVDIFTVGSDWEGKFDYLNEYCKVVYLPRTEGVSSSEIREHIRSVSVGVVGDSQFINKFVV